MIKKKHVSDWDFIMAKIGIIDADLIDHGTRHPNLALMKIAGYFVEKGNDVSLVMNYDDIKKYDKLYLGSVFDFTKIPDWVLKLPNITYGGTGIFPDGGPNLPEEIEHHMPYYDLYLPYVEEQIKAGKKPGHFDDYRYYSIGFTTRGCFRKCSFCVNKKYDHAFAHSHVKEFLDESKPYIYLWDDNILAYGKWREVLDEIEATNKPFQFRQGIDLRLMTDEIADRFLHAKYHGDFIFAFDHIEDKDKIVNKVQLWKRHTSKICKMYVIAGYNSQDEKDIEDVFERIHTLMIYGSLPYIMRYQKYKESPYKEIYIQLARWCNQPQFFKKMSFREFCLANQAYKKNQDTNCSAYQSMLDFEEKFPQIAKKYFDLKFEQENIYREQYGYGRRYANKPLCSYCKANNLSWEFLQDKPLELCTKFLAKEIDIGCLNYKNKECSLNEHKAALLVLKALESSSFEDIIKNLKNVKVFEGVTKDNIPQFSNFDDSIYNILESLYSCEEGVSFDDLGYYLNRDRKEYKENAVALKKYGENHAKLTTQLGLATLYTRPGEKSIVKITALGKVYYNLPKDERERIVAKLCLRIPIVRDQILASNDVNIIDEELKILADKTQKRRRSNVKTMVKYIHKVLTNE